MKTLDSGFRRNDVKQHQTNFFTASGDKGEGVVNESLDTLTPALSRLRAEPFSGQARQGRGGKGKPINRQEGKTMKVFLWIAFLIIVIVAIFAVQNSSAPLITINFLLWKFETSLVYMILGSIVLGILITFLFWISRAVGASLRKGDQNKEKALT